MAFMKTVLISFFVKETFIKNNVNKIILHTSVRKPDLAVTAMSGSLYYLKKKG